MATNLDVSKMETKMLMDNTNTTTISTTSLFTKRSHLTRGYSESYVYLDVTVQYSTLIEFNHLSSVLLGESVFVFLDFRCSYNP